MKEQTKLVIREWAESIIIAVILLAVYFPHNPSISPLSSSDSSSSNSGTETSSSELIGQYYSNWSYCQDGPQDGFLACGIGQTITNNGNSPIDLAGTWYAVVNNRVYKATDTPSMPEYPGIVLVTINPGETKKGGAEFNVPAGLTISKIFLSSDGNESDATVTIEVQKSIIVD